MRQVATVLAVDLGIKTMTPVRMAERGMRVHVLPAGISPDELVARARAVEGPVGVFFSNGPGDPATADHAVAQVRALLAERIPVFGICFGNQILGRALGFGTYKLGYGHRGINQPVSDRATGRVEITAHNHGFAVDAPAGPRLRHRVRPGRGQPRLPQRRRRRRTPLPGRASLLRAVPPGGGRRAARLGLPVRSLRRPHGGMTCATGTSTTRPVSTSSRPRAPPTRGSTTWAPRSSSPWCRTRRAATRFYRDARMRRLTRYRYNNIPNDAGGRYFYLNDGGDVWTPSWMPVQGRAGLLRGPARHGLHPDHRVARRA